MLRWEENYLLEGKEFFVPLSKFFITIQNGLESCLQNWLQILTWPRRCGQYPAPIPSRCWPSNLPMVVVCWGHGYACSPDPRGWHVTAPARCSWPRAAGTKRARLWGLEPPEMHGGGQVAWRKCWALTQKFEAGRSKVGMWGPGSTITHGLTGAKGMGVGVGVLSPRASYPRARGEGLGDPMACPQPKQKIGYFILLTYFTLFLNFIFLVFYFRHLHIKPEYR